MKIKADVLNNIGLFIAISSLCLVIPYASNATVVALIVASFCRCNLKELLMDFRKKLKNSYFMSCLTIVIIGFFSCFWSVDASISANLAFRLLMLLIFLNINLFIINRLPVQTINKLQKTAIAAVLLTLIFYSIDLATNGALASVIKGYPQLTLTRIGRGAAVLCLLMLPTAVMIYKQTQKIFLSFLFILFCGAIITLLPMRAPIISLALSVITFVIIYMFRAKAIIVVFMGIVFSIIFAPTISSKFINLKTTYSYSNYIPSSWRHRLVIWEYCSSLAMEKPFYGYGLESSRTLGKDAPRKLITTDKNQEHPTKDSALPLHPHNMAIQIWLELGFFGILGFCILFLNLMKLAITNLNDKSSAATIGGITVAVFFISSFSFGIWQNWWLAGIFLSIITTFLSQKNHLKTKG